MQQDVGVRNPVARRNTASALSLESHVVQNASVRTARILLGLTSSYSEEREWGKVAMLLR